MSRFSLRRFVTAALAVAAFGISARADTILKANDRVVIYGDSITEQRLYSRYVQQYVYCRYPELKVKFINAGWSGDTAPGGLNRLERDVLSLNPTVVTLFFGMNDGGYKPVAQDTIDRYRGGMEGIIKTLQAKGVRVVVFTPGAVDYDRRAPLRTAEYNKTLEALGNVGKELAAKYNLPFQDVIHPMIEFQDAQKAKNPQFTMTPDSVHPAPAGHLVMAQQMLKGLGADPMPALGTIDIANNQAQGLKVVNRTPTQIDLESTAPVNVPFWFDQSSTAVMRDSGFLNMSGQKLTVKGLAPGAYRITVGGAVAGAFSAEDLAAGATLPGSYSAQGKRVHDLTEMKENNYYTAWRTIRLPLGGISGSQQVVDGLMAADEGFHAMIHTAATPQQKISLSMVVAPEGTNLALNKRYEVSDPNGYNWGIGGLTDGSWETTPQHAFATGDKDAFPKTATIDLEQAARVGMVMLGVPEFGSTKNVKVAVSKDGKEFTEVGTHQFSLNKAERYTYTFAPTEARYVRVIFPDHYDEEAGYSKNFSFMTEVEVYAPGKGALAAP